MTDPESRRRHLATIELTDVATATDITDLLDFCIEGEGQQNTPFSVESNMDGTYEVYRTSGFTD